MIRKNRSSCFVIRILPILSCLNYFGLRTLKKYQFLTNPDFRHFQCFEQKNNFDWAIYLVWIHLERALGSWRRRFRFFDGTFATAPIAEVIHLSKNI